MKSKKIAVVFGSIILAASAIPAKAETRKDALNNVYINELVPGSVHNISLDGTPRTRTVTANRCGVAKLSASLSYSAATQISLASVVSDLSTLPVASPGSCSSVAGVYTLVDAPTATRFKDAIGAVYVQGVPASSEQVFSYPELFVSRKITANACGYVKVSSTISSPLTGATVIKFDNDPIGFTVGDLSTTIAPSCKKISETQSVMMISITDKRNWGS